MSELLLPPEYRYAKIIKESPNEDGGRTDKDDRFFGRTQSNS